MNSLMEYLIQDFGEHVLQSTCSQNTPSEMPSIKPPVTDTSLLAPLCINLGTPAPIALDPSSSPAYNVWWLSDPTSKILAGAKVSQQRDICLEKPELWSSSIDPEHIVANSFVDSNLLTEWMRKVTGRPMPEHWYDDPIDRMLMFLGEPPRESAKYTVPPDPAVDVHSGRDGNQKSAAKAR